MSAIMRRRRSLFGLSLIEGSCPEVGVGNPQFSGRDASPRYRVSLTWLALSSPLAPLRAQRIPARAGSFIGPYRPLGVCDAAAIHVPLVRIMRFTSKRKLKRDHK